MSTYTVSSTKKGMAGNRRGTCHQCVKFALTTYTIQLEGDLSEFLKDKTKQQDFFRYVNGMLNEKGGLLVLHAENLDQLGDFDQKVDDRLQAMIPDGKLYHNVYERFTMPNHVIFRVKPNVNKTQCRLYSTLDFNTKISVNKGKANPTYTQMSTLIHDVCSNKTLRNVSSQPPASSIDFKFMEQVEIQRENSREYFQESMTIQAKACELESNTLEELLMYCWEKVKLNEYISAFTKIREGGSMFIGVFEEKLMTDKWESVTADVSHIVQVKGKGWRLWRDRSQEDHCILYVVKEGSAPQKEAATGKIKCKGVKLRLEDRPGFTSSVLEKVREKLVWLGSEPPLDPVSVKFHSVANQTEECCVIEVQINYYHGVCFHVSNGPECYRSKFPTSYNTRKGQKVPPHSELEKVTLEEWIKPYLRQLRSRVDSDDDTDEEDEDASLSTKFQIQEPVYSEVEHETSEEIGNLASALNLI